VAAYQSKSGKRYENHEIGRAADRSGGSPMPQTKAMPQGEEQPGQGNMEQPIEEVVGAHGPADEMEIHSKHRDGHVHKAKHHDAHSAHHHVDTAMPQQQEEQGGGDMGGMAEHKGFQAV
jgi:hypothetical protein